MSLCIIQRIKYRILTLADEFNGHVLALAKKKTHQFELFARTRSTRGSTTVLNVTHCQAGERRGKT